MTYYIVPNICGEKVRENIENHANINFSDKYFVIARGKPTPTAKLWISLNYCEKYFRNWMSNQEILKNVVPRKFGAIR